MSLVADHRWGVLHFDPPPPAVERVPDPDHPIEIAGTVWPCLMLGQMLFSRAGVRLRAGTNNAVAGVADRSTLHEVFLRRHRPTSDMSFVWGHNSQWKTDFRRDYLTTEAYHFNIDGRIGLNSSDLDPDGLTVTTAGNCCSIAASCATCLTSPTKTRGPATAALPFDLRTSRLAR